MAGTNTIQVQAKVVLDTTSLEAQIQKLIGQVNTKLQNAFNGKQFFLKNFTINAGNVKIASSLGNKIVRAIEQQLRGQTIKMTGVRVDQATLQTKAEQIGRQFAKAVTKSINTNLHNGNQLKLTSLSINTNGVQSFGKQIGQSIVSSIQAQLSKARFNLGGLNGLNSASNGWWPGAGSLGAGTGSNSSSSSSSSSTAQTAQLQKLQSEMRQLIDLYNSANRIMRQMKFELPGSTGFDKLQSDLDTTNSKIKTLEQTVLSARSAFAANAATDPFGINGSSSLINLANNFDVGKNKYTNNLAELKSYTGQVRLQLQELQSIQQQYQQATDMFARAKRQTLGSTEYNNFRQQAEQMRQLADQMQASYQQRYPNMNNLQGAALQQILRISQQINNVRSKSVDIENQMDRSMQKLSADYQSLLARMQAFATRNQQNLTGTTSQSLQNLIAQTRTNLDAGNISTTGLDSVKQRFGEIQLAAAQASNSTQQFDRSLWGTIKRMAQYAGINTVFYSIQNTIRSMINDVHNLDTAMTELRKVTDESDATYASFLDDAGSKAVEIGATVTDVVNATAEFARLGYDIKDAFNLSEAATVFSAVGDDINGITDASDSIISALSAFKIEASDAISVVDKYNEVGNRFSSSSGDIASALTRSAAALSQAGNSIDESIGLVIAGNQVVRDADVVGTALKTLSLRITSTKAELEAMGEDGEGAVESISKLRDTILALTNHKVDIIDEDGYKSSFKILQEISKEWENLSHLDQQALAELLGGKLQANVLMSILDNFDLAEDAMEVSLNSMGSAARENEAVLESMDGKIAQFRASVEQLSSNTFESDMLKGFIDAGISIVQMFNNIAEKGLALPAIIAAISAALSAFNRAAIFTVNKSGTGMEQTFTQWFAPFSNTGRNVSQNYKANAWTNQLQFFGKSLNQWATERQYSKILDKEGLKGADRLISAGDVEKLNAWNVAVTEYNQKIAAGAQANVQFTGTTQGMSKAAESVALGMKNASNGAKIMDVNLESLKSAANTSRLAMIGLQAASMAMSAAMSFGISALIQLAVQGIDYLIHWNENQIQEAQEVISAWDDVKTRTDDQISNIESLRDEYDRLSTGVDAYGRNVSLSADEYARYQEILQSIVGDNVSLIAGYDEENNLLVEKNTLLERAIELQKQQQEIAKQEYLRNGDEILEGDIAKYDEVVEKIKDQFWELDKQLKGVNMFDLDQNWLTPASYDGYRNMHSSLLNYLQDLRNEGKITQEELDGCASVLANISRLEQEVNASDDSMVDYLKVYAADNATYKELSEERQNLANRIISNTQINYNDRESVDSLKKQTDAYIEAVAQMSSSSAFSGFDEFVTQLDEGSIKLTTAQERIKAMGEELAGALDIDYDEAVSMLGLSKAEDKLIRLQTRIQDIEKQFPGADIVKRLSDSSISAVESFDSSIGKIEKVYGDLSSIPQNVMSAMVDVIDVGADVDIESVYTFIDALEQSKLGIEDVQHALENAAGSSTGFLNLDRAISQVETLNRITDALSLTEDDVEQINSLWTALTSSATDGGASIGDQIYYLDKAFSSGKIDAATYDSALKNVLGTLQSIAQVDLSGVFDSMSRSMDMESVSKALAEANEAISNYNNADVGVRQFMTEGISSQVTALETLISSAAAAHDVGAYSDLTILKSQLEEIASIANDPIGRVGAVFDTVSQAMGEMQEQGTLSLESFSALKALGPQFASAMSVSAGGVRVNTEALQQLTRAEIEEQKAQLEANKSRNYDQLSRINAELNDLIGTNRELTASEQDRVQQLLGERDTILGLIDTYDAMTAAIEQAAGARAQLADALERGSKADVANIWKEGYEKAKEYLENGQIGDARDILRNMVSSDIDLSTPEALVRAFEQLSFLAGETSDAIGVLYGKIADQTAAGAFDNMLSHAERMADGSIQLHVYEQELDAVAKALGVSTDMLRDFISAQSAWSLDDGALNVEQITEDLRAFDGVVSDVGGRVTINLEAMKTALANAGWSTNDINQLVLELSQAENIDLTDATGEIINFVDAAQGAHSSSYWSDMIDDINATGDAISNLDKSAPNDLMTFLQNLASQGKYTREQIAGITGSLMTDQGYTFTINGQFANKDEVDAAIQSLEITWDSTKSYIESNGVEINVDTDPAALATLAGDTDTLKNWLALAKQSGDTVAVEKVQMAIEYAESGSIEGLTQAAMQSLDALKAKLQEVFKLKLQGAWGINTAMPLVARSKQVVDDLYKSLTKVQNFKVKISVDYNGLNNAKSAANSLKNALNSIPKNLTTTHTVKTNYTTSGLSSGSQYYTSAQSKTGSADSRATSHYTPKATGTRSAKRETALVNDGAPVNGSAGELIIRKDSSDAFIANGGRLAMVDLFPGDIVLTARETQDVLHGGNGEGLRFKRYAGGLQSTWKPTQTTQSKPTTSSSSSSSSKPSSSSSSSSSSNRGSSSSSSPSSSSSSSSASAAKDEEDAWKKAFENEYKYFKHMLNMKYISEAEYFNAVDSLWRKYFAGREEYLDEQWQYEEEVFQGRLNLVKTDYEKELKYLQYLLDMEMIEENEFYDQRYRLAERYYKDNIHFVEEWRDAEVAAHEAVYTLTEQRLSQAEKELGRALSLYKINQTQYDDALYNLRILTYGPYEEHYEDELSDAYVEHFEAELDRRRRMVEDGVAEIERQVSLNEITREQADKAIYRLKHVAYGTNADIFKDELADAEVEIYESRLEARNNRLDKALKQIENDFKLGLIEDQATVDNLKAQLTSLILSSNPEAFEEEIADAKVDRVVSGYQMRVSALERTLAELKRLYETDVITYKEYIERIHKASLEAYGDDDYFKDERADESVEYYKNRKEARLNEYNEELSALEHQHDLGLIEDREYLDARIDLYKEYLRGDKRFKEEAADAEVNLHKELVNQAKADYEKELKLLENSLDMGEIAVSEFYQKRLDLAEHYLGGIKDLEEDLADVYKQTYEDRVELQQDYWERALQGVEYAIDKEIEKREKAQEAEAEPYEKLIKSLSKEARNIQRQQQAQQREQELTLRPYDEEIRDLQRKEKELTVRYKRLIRPYQDAQREKQKEQEKLQRAQDLELRPLEKELHALDRQSTWIEKLYDDRLYPLEQELKMLQKIEETKEDELAVDEARYKLAKAMTERSNLVYREGLGFVYEVNKDAIREAQQSKDEAEKSAGLTETEKRIKELEDLIDQIEEEREAELRPINDRSWWLDWWSEDINDKYENLLEPIEDWLYDMGQFLDELDWEQTLTLRPIQDRLEDLDMIRDDINYVYERASTELADALYDVNLKLDKAQDELDSINEKYEGQIKNLNKMKDILKEQEEYWNNILNLQIAQKVFGEEAWRDFNTMLQQSNDEWNQALADRVQGFSDVYSDLFALAGQSLNDYEGLINKTFDTTELRADVLAQKLKDFQSDLISAAEYMDYLAQYEWNQNKQSWLPSVDNNNMTTSTSSGQKPQLPDSVVGSIPTVNNPNPQQPQANPDYNSNEQLGYANDIAKILDQGQKLLTQLTLAREEARKKGPSVMLAAVREANSFLEKYKLTAEAASKNKVDGGTAAAVLLAKLAQLANLDLGNYYASGRKTGSVAELAVTQESGPEAILHTSKGQFTFLAPKDMVFSNRQTENLWELSRFNPASIIGQHTLPQTTGTVAQSKTAYNLSIGDVVIQRADDPESLSKAIISRLPNQILQDMSRR